MTRSIPQILDCLETLFYKTEYLKILQIVLMTKELQVKDVCIYAPGDPNKIGKEGKPVGIVFHAIQMGHNVWSP